jgi:hypothetical protein
LLTGAPLPKPLSIEEALKQGTTRRDKEELKNEMPSWIPFIEKSAFGEPHGYLGGRINGDSLVGGSERRQKPYNADGDLKAWIEFGRVDEPEKLPVPARSSTLPINFNFNKHSGNGNIKPSKLNPIQENGNYPKPEISTKDKGTETTSPAPSKYDGSLTVKGIHLDTVDSVSPRVTARGVIPEEALTMGGWIHKDPPMEDQEVPDQLWRTLVADRGPNGTSAPPWYRRACLECLEHTDRQGDLDIEDLKKKTQPKKTPSMMIAFLERVQQIVWGRRFFKTKGKPGKDPLFGLGSQDIKAGDMICILFGCSVPVVLRKVHEPGKVYHKFIGECYVHGMMDGEAIIGKPPTWPYGGKKISKFKLM